MFALFSSTKPMVTCVCYWESRTGRRVLIVKRKTRILIMQGAKDENERVLTEEEATNIDGDIF